MDFICIILYLADILRNKSFPFYFGSNDREHWNPKHLAHDYPVSETTFRADTPKFTIRKYCKITKTTLKG